MELHSTMAKFLSFNLVMLFGCVIFARTIINYILQSGDSADVGF